MKLKMKSKALAILMSLAMAFTMIPMMGAPVYADDPAPAAPGIALGPDVLSVGSNTSGAATVHMADKTWRVIGYKGEGVASTKAYPEVAGSTDTMTLIAAKALKPEVEFRLDVYTAGAHNYGKNINNEDSDLKKEIDKLTGTGTEKIFSDEEIAGIVPRTLESGEYNIEKPQETDCIAGDEVKGALLWPLSTKEANTMNQNLRILNPVDQGLSSSYWWLRSPANGYNYASYVEGSGNVYNKGFFVQVSYALRPAFNYDLKSVIFTSAAVSGKSSGAVGAGALEPVGTNAGNEWKLTVESGHEDFKITGSSYDNASQVLTVYYSGAVTNSSGNEYVSAVVVDKDGNITHYGNIKQCENSSDASGQIEINLDGILSNANKSEIYIFNEQVNDDGKTDYASPLTKVDMPALDHYHNWSTEWNSDENKHWHECAVCKERKDEADHQWKIEQSTDGDRCWFKCDVCDKVASDSDLGSGTAADPYKIGTADRWNKFAKAVENGLKTGGKYFCLTDDINVTTMMGTQENPFGGTFDGAGHTLDFTSEDHPERTAPFRYVDGTAISNLHVTGSITGTKCRASGLIGENSGSSTVTNCRVSATLSGSSLIGGFCIGTGDALDITGCVFDGKIRGESEQAEQPEQSGLFVAWGTDGLSIKDSIAAPGEGTAFTGGTFYHDKGKATLSNCYYTRAVGTAQGKQARSVKADEGVDISFGNGTEYTVSRITAYGTGVEYNDVFYGGKDDRIALTMPDISSQGKSYFASAGVLTGNGTNYTLVMPDKDVVISDKERYSITIHWSSVEGEDKKEPIRIRGIKTGTTIADALDAENMSLNDKFFEEKGYSGVELVRKPMMEYDNWYIAGIDGAEGTDKIEEDLDFFYLMAKHVNQVSLTVKAPLCGTETKTEKNGNGEWNEETQTNKPQVIFPGNAECKEPSQSLPPGFWGAIDHDKERLYPIETRFEGGENYTAILWFEPKIGYVLTPDTKATLKGGEIKACDLTRVPYYIEAEIRAEHDWDAGVVTKPATTAATGEMLRTCNGCGVKKTEIIPQLTKKTNPLKIKGKIATVKYKKLKKKTQALAVTKVIKFTKKGQGKMSYKKSAVTYTKAKSVKMSKKALKKYKNQAVKKITINKTTGKVTVKKGLKKGTYKVKVEVMAAGNANYNPSAWKTVTFKVKIK